jgi:hypothetical protein
MYYKFTKREVRELVTTYDSYIRESDIRNILERHQGISDREMQDAFLEELNSWDGNESCTAYELVRRYIDDWTHERTRESEETTDSVHFAGTISEEDREREMNEYDEKFANESDNLQGAKPF